MTLFVRKYCIKLVKQTIYLNENKTTDFFEKKNS